jgi:aryl-alcohol dehydrogenase-like predicted oxidoreductase
MLEAFNHGVNYFDTAEVYASGECEKVFGQALRNLGFKRSDIVVSTKLFWGGAGPNDTGLSKKHVFEGMNASLSRLGLDYVDIVMAHRPDPLTPMEEIVRAFTHLGPYCQFSGPYYTTNPVSSSEQPKNPTVPAIFLDIQPT